MNPYESGTSNGLVYLDHIVSTVELDNFDGTVDRDSLSNIMKNNIVIFDLPVYLDEKFINY